MYSQTNFACCVAGCAQTKCSNLSSHICCAVFETRMVSIQERTQTPWMGVLCGRRPNTRNQHTIVSWSRRRNPMGPGHQRTNVDGRRGWSLKGQERKKKDIWTARQVNHDLTSRFCSTLFNCNRYSCTGAFFNLIEWLKDYFVDLYLYSIFLMSTISRFWICWGW